MTAVQLRQTQEFARQAAAAWEQRPQTRYPFAVVAGQTVTGVAELHLRATQQGEIGYSIHPGRWGRGYATAAARLLLDAAFHEHGLHRVYATCDPRNTASAQVLRKLGMTHEGRMRETVLIRDGWRDSDLYAVLSHEWPPAAG